MIVRGERLGRGLCVERWTVRECWGGGKERELEIDRIKREERDRGIEEEVIRRSSRERREGGVG